MIVNISSDAELDIVEGYDFYERQEPGLGKYFRDSIVADIESLTLLGGIHSMQYGFRRTLCKTFPFVIYYEMQGDIVTVVAVIDGRRNPAWIRHRLT